MDPKKISKFPNTVLSLVMASGLAYGGAATAQSAIDGSAMADVAVAADASATVEQGDMVDALSGNISANAEAGADAAVVEAAGVAATEDSISLDAETMVDATTSAAVSGEIGSAASAVAGDVAEQSVIIGSSIADDATALTNQASTNTEELIDDIRDSVAVESDVDVAAEATADVVAVITQDIAENDEISAGLTSLLDVTSGITGGLGL